MDIDIQALHQRTPITDGHADSLMWNRDLSRASSEGHVDFPRLRQAGVKIQCFTLVTRGLPFINGFPVFAWHRGWPREARRSEWTRTLWQLNQMEAFCLKSNGAASIVKTGTDLQENLHSNTLSVVLGIEGAHALEAQVDRIQELFKRGVRFMSLTHLSNNELGGASSPLMGNRGLTALGRNVLEVMVDVGMAVDIAHASQRTLDEILEHPRARLFCSHGGVVGAKALWRNIPDSALKKIAERGGVMGVIFAPMYLGGRRFEDVARHLEHTMDVMGVEGAALGSDFDGMVPLPRGMRDVRDLHLLTECLLQRGHSEETVERILGRNFRRFLAELLG